MRAPLYLPLEATTLRNMNVRPREDHVGKEDIVRRHRNENIVGTTASDLRAMAEDMLRMGTHWAQAAQGWLDRTRQDVEARDRRQRCASERSGRDFQSDYSGGGYDQVRGSRGNFGARGGYRGVGPRNYARSDERIREDLNERLTEADDLDASDLTVEVSNGVATLGGMVPQRWMKHRAEDLADGCTGVRDVRNQIRVGDGTSGGGAEAHGSVNIGGTSAEVHGSMKTGSGSPPPAAH